MDGRQSLPNQESTSMRRSSTRVIASMPESGAFQILRCEAFTRRPAFTNPSPDGRASNPPLLLPRRSNQTSFGNLLRGFQKNGTAGTPQDCTSSPKHSTSAVQRFVASSILSEPLQEIRSLIGNRRFSPYAAEFRKSANRRCSHEN